MAFALASFTVLPEDLKRYEEHFILDELVVRKEQIFAEARELIKKTTDKVVRGKRFYGKVIDNWKRDVLVESLAQAEKEAQERQMKRVMMKMLQRQLALGWQGWSADQTRKSEPTPDTGSIRTSR